jgi:ABC-type nitrate/sulfonate/bicarbonate transport system substrate-binding protein
MFGRDLARLSVAIGALAIGVTAAHAEDHIRVGVPEPSAFMFAVLDVGMAEKFFERHGVTIEKLDFAGGGKLQEGMTAGAVDVSLTGNGEMAFIAKGAPEKAVAVTAGAPVDMAIITRTDGSITHPADLKGKTIGVTSPTSLTSWIALEFSRRQGWGPDGVKRASVGGMSSEVAGLVTKNLDAIVGPLEGAFLLQEKGQGQPFITFADVKVYITHAMYARNALMQEHPEALRRFLAAWFETVAFVKSHKEDTIRLVEPATKLPPAIAAKVYDIEAPALADHGRFDPKAVDAVVQSLLDVTLIDAKPANNKDLYTEQYLP